MGKDPLTEKVIGCAIEVHRHLGPGLLESAYEQCLAHELTAAGIEFQLQVPISVKYKERQIDCGYRLDLLVADRVIIELKSVEKLTDIHQAQLLTYMKISGMGTGLLINFNVLRLIDGIKRLRI